MVFSAFCDILGHDKNATYHILQKEILEWYTDHQPFVWLMWLLIPVVVVFLLPLFTYFLVYLSAFYVELYRYSNLMKGIQYGPSFWDKACYTIAKLWIAYGRIWYGYEIVGIDNIPSTGKGLIIFYHGTVPVDWYLLLSTHFVLKNRLIHAVGDKFLFKLPGFGGLLESMKVYEGSVGICSKLLKEGNLLAIAPGGVREAQFADDTYPLIWGNRKGFAQVALEGQAPIIPVFTQNIREAFCPLSIGKKFFRRMYERIRFPLVPIYGGFPVKLRTIIGKPIPYDSTITADELATKTAAAIKELIASHQHLPGSIIRALLERIPVFYKEKCA